MEKLLKKSFSLILLTAGMLLSSCGPSTPSTELPDVSDVTSETTTETSSKDDNWLDGDFKQFEETLLVDPNTVEIKDNQFHTQKQRAFMLGTWDVIGKHAFGAEELSKPRGCKVILDDQNDKYVQLSLDSEFSNPYVFEFLPGQEGYVKNLLVNQKYYYRTSGDPTTFTGDVKELTVANDLPRNLDVDGVTNVRDLGGYTSKLGGTIKQNMFFRGGRLNGGGAITRVLVTERGLETLTKQLSVKTEIDLRSSADEAGQMNNDVFKDIEYHLIPMNTRNIDNILAQHKPQIKEVFKMYANQDNYPIYVHCKIGTDRTGAVSFLMGALLGMDITDLIKDYLFSNFGEIGSARQMFVLRDQYYPLLRSYGKDTLAKCAEAFLLDCGVTQVEIDSIRNIMLVK